MFVEYTAKQDAPSLKEGNKVFILMDSCILFPALDRLRNLQLEHLPAIPSSTTSLIQLVQHGVINNLQADYRKELVKMTVDSIQDSS